ncbi:cation diffusion facilitator CzcD-associated flavoprotein CzcO [Streptomyces canus]|nr:cation diffusion facilitator CzcD-associated flavoprotein CzcO [Streptomyces canus]
MHRDGELLRVETNSGIWHARAVISVAGTWWRPFLPAVPGRGHSQGRQLHTVEYRGPHDVAGQRVVIVGGGNSGAQIAADLAYDTEQTWVTQRPPRYLADDIDGHALFDAATARRRALDEGRTDSGGVASLGGIVAVPPVREARDRGGRRAAERVP